MPPLPKATDQIAQLTNDTVKLGDLRTIAKQIGKDHDLAMELWSSGVFHPRLLASLIFDKKLLTEDDIDRLAADILRHEPTERTQLADWLMANQLAKEKRLAALMETWEAHASPILRRWFWYHQARLRWMGGVQPGNSAELLDSLETKMADAEPEVQWAMNFCACQIGLHEPALRSRCIALGEALGLYKDDHVSRNCTPNYLPEFIRIELAKKG